MIVADAYNVTSGLIDAVVWLLVYGLIAAIIFKIVKTFRKSKDKSNPGELAIRKKTVKKKPASKGWDLTSNFDFLNQLPPPDNSQLPLSQSQWLEDPTGDYDERFWDGIKWTRLVRQKNGSELWQLQRQEKADEIGLPVQSRQTNVDGVGNQNEQKIGQPDSQNIVADLRELTGLFDRGALTIEEFGAAKERLLGGEVNRE